MNPLRVLHIDDETDIREVVAISLGLDPEFSVRGCASGAEGLADAAEHVPNLILLDVMMPVMDGPATLAQLRGNPQTADIPVVFMTARAQARELAHFKSLGAVGVIAKPFDPMTLAASVRSHMPTPNDGLAAARGIFLERVSQDAHWLAGCRLQLARKRQPELAIARIREIAHGLAGAGGIFGYAEISSRAATLEQAVIELDDTDTPRRVDNAIERLLACLAAVNANDLAKVDHHVDG